MTVISAQELVAQDCNFDNDDMDDIECIRRCMARFGPGNWINTTSLIHQLRLSEPLKKVGALGGGCKQRMERSGAGCGPGDAPRM